jgi:MFS family permease
MGIFANIYGRKIVLIACLIPSSLGVFFIGFSPNYTFVLIFYGFAGFCIPFLNFSVLWINEIGENNYQVLANGVIQIG